MDATLWERRELPILQAIAEADAAAESIDSSQIVEATGLEATAVGRALKALIDADYVDGIDTTTTDDPAPTYTELELARLGREAVGSWQPSAAPAGTAPVDQQVILEVLIASPSDTEEQRDSVERAIWDWNGLHAVEQRTHGADASEWVRAPATTEVRTRGSGHDRPASGSQTTARCSARDSGPVARGAMSCRLHLVSEQVHR